MHVLKAPWPKLGLALSSCDSALHRKPPDVNFTYNKPWGIHCSFFLPLTISLETIYLHFHNNEALS